MRAARFTTETPAFVSSLRHLLSPSGTCHVGLRRHKANNVSELHVIWMRKQIHHLLRIQKVQQSRLTVCRLLGMWFLLCGTSFDQSFFYFVSLDTNLIDGILHSKIIILSSFTHHHVSKTFDMTFFLLDTFFHIMHMR